jgi:hypothetical protein
MGISRAKQEMLPNHDAQVKQQLERDKVHVVYPNLIGLSEKSTQTKLTERIIVYEHLPFYE